VSGAITESSIFSSSQKTDFGRMQSIRAFSISSEANEMIKGLRYFERASKSGLAKPALSWGKVDMRTFGKSLIELCIQTRSLLIQEPRLIKLKSPTYILGKPKHGLCGPITLTMFRESKLHRRKLIIPDKNDLLLMLLLLIINTSLRCFHR
jgi:hypothetical protein